MSKNLGVTVLLDFYGVMLTAKQRDMVELYYNEDLSLAEIAEHTGITRQGVRDCIKRAEGKLVNYERKLKLVFRFYNIEEKVQEIYENAEEMIEFNKRFGANNLINTSAVKIKELASEIIEEV